MGGGVYSKIPVPAHALRGTSGLWVFLFFWAPWGQGGVQEAQLRSLCFPKGGLPGSPFTPPFEKEWQPPQKGPRAGGGGILPAPMPPPARGPSAPGQTQTSA